MLLLATWYTLARPARGLQCSAPWYSNTWLIQQTCPVFGEHIAVQHSLVSAPRHSVPYLVLLGSHVLSLTLMPACVVAVLVVLVRYLCSCTLAMLTLLVQLMLSWVVHVVSLEISSSLKSVLALLN